jgi:predicted transposase YdaD
MPILNDTLSHEVIGPAILKGREQGREEGKEEGREQGRREIVHRLLESLFSD